MWGALSDERMGLQFIPVTASNIIIYYFPEIEAEKERDGVESIEEKLKNNGKSAPTACLVWLHSLGANRIESTAS
jgi:hypothetical protein